MYVFQNECPVANFAPYIGDVSYKDAMGQSVSLSVRNGRRS